MAVLTAIMVIGKTTRAGRRAVRPVGLALLAVGVLVLAHSTWLPAAVTLR